MFLFPKDLASNSEINSSNIVLKDKNNNRIIIPLRSTISWNQYGCIIPNSDEFQKIDLSKNDLKGIYDQFNALLNSENSALFDNENAEDFSFESYFKDQELELQALKETSMMDATDSEKVIASTKLPTQGQLMSTHDYILRTEQEIIPMFKNSEFDSESKIYNSNYEKLPSILRDQTIELDVSNIKRFATEFKSFRIFFDLSQKDITTSIEQVLKKIYDQSTICRFESLSLNLSNMKELIRCVRAWLKKIYAAGIENTMKNLKRHIKQVSSSEDDDSNKGGNESNIVEEINDTGKSENEDWVGRKNREKRTIYSGDQKKRLENLFQTVKHTQITVKVYDKYAQELNLSRKVIQTWMTKRRRIEREREQIKRKKARK